MLLFWLKYLFHLRLFANNQQFMNRLGTSGTKAAAAADTAA
jgi:hypothetical protein